MKISRSLQLVAALKAMSETRRTVKEYLETQKLFKDRIGVHVAEAALKILSVAINEAVRAALAVEEPDTYTKDGTLFCRSCGTALGDAGEGWR